MKPVFGIDITTIKNNVFFEGKEFVVQTVSEKRQETLKQAKRDKENLENTAQFTLPVRMISSVLGMVCFIACVFLLSISDKQNYIGLKEIYNDYHWLFGLGIISLLAYVILNIIHNNRLNKVFKTEEGKQIQPRITIFTDSCYADMLVPANAENVDIISFTYKIKNGKPIAKMNNSNLKSLTPYRNLNTRMFVKNEHLYIADTENKYAFSLSEMSRIRTINKSIPLPEWNKEIPYNKGVYKAYKMDYYGGENLRVKPYHILELNHNGEVWGICFPCYELPVFEELTGLKAEQ